MKKTVLTFIASIFAFVAVTATANAATFYSSEALFLAATSGLSTEGFETATTNSTTEVGFSGGTFSCTGITYCPGFFGISTILAEEGSRSVFFASPDTVTFTFNSVISSFGIFIGGLGDILGTTTLTVTNSNGETTDLFDGHSGTGVFGANTLFGGLVDTAGFTSITFGGSLPDDAIFFDVMRTGSNELSTVPLPAALPLYGAGVAIIGFIGWRRKHKVATTI